MSASASPVLVGDRIYATNEGGETFVFEASPEKFTQIAKCKLGDEAFATPAIARKARSNSLIRRSIAPA